MLSKGIMISKLKKKRMKLLVEALRSGKYKQTGNCLRDEKSYCCLGVACDIYRKETGKGRWRSLGSPRELKSFQGSTGYLPDKVMEWFGFPIREGFESDNVSLARRNDAGHSFQSIADLIEKHYDL